MRWQVVDKNSKTELIEVLPYCDCYEIAISKLVAQGYDVEKLRLAEESDILGNVPFMVFGCRFRAVKGIDIDGEICYYLNPTGYKIPVEFIKKE